MFVITLIFIVFLFCFVGAPALYLFYMKRFFAKPWQLKYNEQLVPNVTVIVPMHNEERVIQLKMENLVKVSYPREKLQIIIVNDGSTDDSVEKVKEFQKSNFNTNIQLLDNPGPRGKTNGLNFALHNSTGDIVVVSDADCFLGQETLRIAVKFLSDPSVGAVTGLERLLNYGETWVTQTEVMFNDIYQTIQVGESKQYSTIIFQGGFAAYKRNMVSRFDEVADDSGTALGVVQKGLRTLLVPEALYFTMSSKSFKGKFSTKLRRANSMLRTWLKCWSLFQKRKLLLPKQIFLPEFFLYFVNPFIFAFLLASYGLLIFENQVFFLAILAILVVGVLISKVRRVFVETVQNQLYLLGAIFLFLFGRSFTLWKSEPRELVDRELLKSKNLI
jgi:poly-beta-1,6-N-acetyl-D-glucosamine synthase